jgi:hypothetical protein
LGVSDKDAGALPADQAVGDEEAAAPLDEEGAAAPPMQMEAMTEIKEGQRSLLFLFQFCMN